MFHWINTEATRLKACVPNSKQKDWKVGKNIGFGSVMWNPEHVIVDHSHYDTFFRNATCTKRKRVITGKEFRKRYARKKGLMGAAFYRFFHNRQDILQAVCEPWFATFKGEKGAPFLFFLGTEFKDKKSGTTYWIFLHKRPDGRVGMGFLSTEGSIPTSSRVLRYRV